MATKLGLGSGENGFMEHRVQDIEGYAAHMDYVWNSAEKRASRVSQR